MFHYSGNGEQIRPDPISKPERVYEDYYLLGNGGIFFVKNFTFLSRRSGQNNFFMI